MKKAIVREDGTDVAEYPDTRTAQNSLHFALWQASSNG